MFTKFDTVDYQQVLMNYIEWSYDDVMIQYFSVKNKPFQLVSTITPLYIMGPWWNLVGLMVDGHWRTHQQFWHHQWRHSSQGARLCKRFSVWLKYFVSNPTTAHCRGVASFLQRLWFSLSRYQAVWNLVSVEEEALYQ